MTRAMRKLLRLNILLITCLISIITVAYSLFSFPLYFQSAISKTDSGMTLLGVFSGVIVFVLVLWLFSFLFTQVKVALRPKDAVPKTLQYAKGLFLLFFLAMAAVLVICILYGLLSVLIFYLFEKSLAIGQIKTIINLCTGLLTLLAMPVFFSVFAAFALDANTIKGSIVKGFSKLKKTYLPCLFFMFLLFSMGYLIVILTDIMDSDLAINITKLVLFSMIGTGVILVSFTVYELK